MKRLRKLNAFRDRHWERRLGAEGDDTGGCFKVASETRLGTELSVLVGVGEGWEHISVSTPLRCPTWAEMEQVKRMFFEPHETAMQLHVAPTDHISIHPHCLHIWRPVAAEIPLPPKWMVG